MFHSTFHSIPRSAFYMQPSPPPPPPPLSSSSSSFTLHTYTHAHTHTHPYQVMSNDRLVVCNFETAIQTDPTTCLLVVSRSVVAPSNRKGLAPEVISAFARLRCVYNGTGISWLCILENRATQRTIHSTLTLYNVCPPLAASGWCVT